MKILITQRELKRFGGSELYAIDLARGLSARGHSVAIYCREYDETFSRLVLAAGASVKDRLADLPWIPDVIHGQHHLQAMAAFSFFPDTPGIYCCHGTRPWVEQPPILGRIVRYVVVCGRMAPVLQAEYDIDQNKVVTINNFADLRRFSRVRSLPRRPTRAALYHGGGFCPDEIARLEHVCSVNGLTLDKIGPSYLNPQPNPEAFLPTFDIVFATGRSAIEALVCGCALIPLHPGRVGCLVTEGNFDEWLFTNFAPRPYSSHTAEDISREWFENELKMYSTSDLGGVTARARSVLDSKCAIDSFETLYETVSTASRAEADPSEFAPYLERLSREVDQIWYQSQVRSPPSPQELFERTVGHLGEAVKTLEGIVGRAEQREANGLLSRIFRRVRAAASI